jgi:hypothetical protein
MKSRLAALVIVIALLVAAEGIRRTARVEATLADAQEQLTTLGAVSRDTDEQLDAAMATAGRVPMLGPRLQIEVRHTRAMQAYWQRDYTALTAGVLAPSTDDTDPTLLLLSANAAFRLAATRTGTPQTLARGLDDVLKAYVNVLDRAPANADAAYNYELVSRLRGALSGGRMSAMPQPDAGSMQGQPGEPPKGTPRSDFNVIVPLRPDERQEQLDPGAGTEFKRKG